MIISRSNVTIRKAMRLAYGARRWLGVSGKSVTRMVKALFDANLLIDCLNAVSQSTILPSGYSINCERSAMMNADQKRASFSTTPVFAELRQVTNELEEARQHSILADGIQQDRCFLLSS
jgi:hypothetical protein